MTRPKALIAWSSGKDSAWALHVARQNGDYDIVGALTTVNDAFARVAMHGVRQQLLEMQIAAAGLTPVLVHILTPGMKPVQVTQDLANFWREHYPKIKSELQRRYPKHEWR